LVNFPQPIGESEFEPMHRAKRLRAQQRDDLLGIDRDAAQAMRREFSSDPFRVGLPILQSYFFFLCRPRDIKPVVADAVSPFWPNAVAAKGNQPLKPIRLNKRLFPIRIANAFRRQFVGGNAIPDPVVRFYQSDGSVGRDHTDGVLDSRSLIEIVQITPPLALRKVVAVESRAETGLVGLQTLSTAISNLSPAHWNDVLERGLRKID
jgi:hypothetical protein